MGPEHVVLDISSDEEDAAVHGLGGDSFDYQSLEWLSKMLELDEPWASEDVVIVDELSCTAPVQKLSSEQSNVEKNVSVDDSDDDCKVLDGDPDKPVEVVQNEGNGSDELLIVGEKGQLACRDFPHSRHLCATFPFGATSHEKFCKLCHCYVCDIPAPCIYWGTGSSSDDHCHSSDKEETWRLKRKAIKRANTATDPSESLPVATPSTWPRGMRPPRMSVPGVRISRNNLPQRTSSSMHTGPQSVPPQTPDFMQVSPRSVPAQTSVSLPIGPASVPLQNLGSRLHTFRHCSATSFGTPNIISQRRNQQSSIPHGGHRNIHQLNRPRNFSEPGSVQRNSHGFSPQIISARAKGRMAVAGVVNVPVKRRMTNTNQCQVYSRKLQRGSCLPPPSVDEDLKEWQDVLLGNPNAETNFRQGVIYPQPELDSQSYTQTAPNVGMNLLNSSAPAIGNPDFLDGRWLNAASMNTTDHVSVANSSLPNVQSINQYAAPEGNPVSAEVSLGERIGLHGQEALQEAAGDRDPKLLIHVHMMSKRC